MWWAELLNNIVGLFSGASAPVVGDYESIATTIVGGAGASEINFTSIPSTFKHLQIRYIARGASGLSALIMSMNGSTGVYRNHYLEGSGSGTPVAGSDAATAGIKIYGSFSSTASTFGAGVIDILDYANTNKNKTTRSLTGVDLNGSGTIDLDSGLYISTSAISSIKLVWEATTFTQYSSFALYGIKG
jgi:hypothetical protein